MQYTLPETHSLPSAKIFAECNISGTRQTKSLPSAALGKTKHSAKNILPSAGHSTKSRQQQTATHGCYLCRVPICRTLGKDGICRVQLKDTRQNVFFSICHQTFSVVILDYLELHMQVWPITRIVCYI